MSFTEVRQAIEDEPKGRRAAFNVLLTEDEFSMLKALAELEGRSKGAMLRRLIRRAYLAEVENIRICGDGTPCILEQQQAARPQTIRRY